VKAEALAERLEWRDRAVVGLRTRGGFGKANGDRVIALSLHPGNSRHVSDHVVLASLDCAHKRALKFRVGKWQSPLVCRHIVGEGTTMAIESLILWLIIGAVAGWLAGLLVKGYGFGLIGNILVGIAGAIIAGWLLPHVGFFLVGGILAEIVDAVIGAVILLLVIGLVRRAA
jgi:uncharacterized membrane protein YeaQ/YmgE (transglycosylase-associated protein family)